MKKFSIIFLTSMLVAANAMAFDLPSVPSADAKEAQMKSCIMQEAQQALTKGTLSKDNIDSQAAKIAASCATKLAVTSDNATVQTAITVIKNLLK